MYCSSKNSKELKAIFDFEIVMALITQFVRLFKSAQFYEYYVKLSLYWVLLKNLFKTKRTNMSAKQTSLTTVVCVIPNSIQWGWNSKFNEEEPDIGGTIGESEATNFRLIWHDAFLEIQASVWGKETNNSLLEKT